ncbi:MAG TPA: DsbA family protein [Rhizomicrobium sp.]|nr:DsbA family protein [Rhizomicrobium sp.]
MNSQWNIAAAGGLIGALAAVVIVFAAASLGLLPHNDAAIHDYLMAHPEIVVAMTDKLQAQQEADEDRAAQTAIDKLGAKALFDPRLAFITGPSQAKKTVVEFFDYNCPYCRLSLPAVKKYYAAHKNDTRFAFIEFPIKGADSIFAARVALAARKQGDKYLALHFLLMGEKDHVDANMILADAEKAGLDMNKLAADMKAPDVNAGVNAALALADAAKIKGTPFFVVNGRIRSGALDDAILKQMAKG